MQFYNRDKERNSLKQFTRSNQRIKVVFSEKGFGKTALISNFFFCEESFKYINISPSELVFEKIANDYYFIEKLAQEIAKIIPKEYFDSCFLRIYNKIPNFQLNISLGLFEIGTNIGNTINIIKQSIISTLNIYPYDIYLHIENTEKIDKESLKFLVQIVKEVPNVFIILECICGNSTCNDFIDFFKNNHIRANGLRLSQLEWNYVERILDDNNITFSNKEYLKYSGNIKELLYVEEEKNFEAIVLNDEEQFLLNLLSEFVFFVSADLVYQILSSYQSLNRLGIMNVNLKGIKRTLDKLLKFDLVLKSNEKMRITEFGKIYTTKDFAPLITQILSCFYMPRIMSKKTSIFTPVNIEALQVLAYNYARNNDDRMQVINNCLNQILPSVYLNEKVIDTMYHILDGLSNNPYTDKYKLIIIKLFVQIGCYQKALELLQNCNNKLSIILECTCLVHLMPEDIELERKLIYLLENSNDEELISALYTCIIGYNMRRKSSVQTKQFYEQQCKNNELILDCDKKIIQKNVSIYYGFYEARKMILDSCKYFRTFNRFQLAIGSYLTLSTRYIQIGELEKGLKILSIIENSSKITPETQAYIDNNISVIHLLTNGLNDKVLQRLKDTYYFCEDLYSKLLVSNNLLIYYLLIEDNDNSKIIANEIENIGFDKYVIDDYLHLAYTNLLWYHTRFKNKAKIYEYKNKLETLLSECDSDELKEYIKHQLYGKNIKPSNRWFYMAQFKYRAAFMGFWFINNFDYS